jgi:cytochrome c553
MEHRTSALNAGQQEDCANNSYTDEYVSRIDPVITNKGKDYHSRTGHTAQGAFYCAKVFCHLHNGSSMLYGLMASIVVFRNIINHSFSRHIIVFLTVLVMMFNTQSANALETRDEILQKVEAVLSSPELQTTAMERGKEHSVLCSQCHGHDGNSSYPWVPNLASQNPIYFIEQSLRFRQQKRKDHIMSEVMKLLSEQQLVGEAVVSRGKGLYQKHCVGCHGKKGLGGSDKSHAWLAGQQAEYLVRTLKRFRGGSNMRGHPTMASVTANLTDAEIESLSLYLSSLH